MAPAYSDREPSLTQAGTAPDALDTDYVDDDVDYDEEHETQPRPSIWRILLPVFGAVLLVVCAGIGYLVFSGKPPANAIGAVTANAPVAGEAAKPGAAATAAAAATPSETATPSAETPPDPAPTPELQSPAAPSPAAAAQLTSERFDSWFVICPVDAPKSPDCFMQQQLRSAKSDALVFVWALRRDDKGVIRAVWQAPAGLDTTQGMVLDAGDGTPRPVPIAACDDKSCVVRGVLAPAYVATLSAATRVTATIFMKSDGRALRYSFDPKGMAAALARLGNTGT